MLHHPIQCPNKTTKFQIHFQNLHDWKVSSTKSAWPLLNKNHHSFLTVSATPMQLPLQFCQCLQSPHAWNHVFWKNSIALKCQQMSWLQMPHEQASKQATFWIALNQKFLKDLSKWSKVNNAHFDTTNGWGKMLCKGCIFQNRFDHMAQICDDNDIGLCWGLHLFCKCIAVCNANNSIASEPFKWSNCFVCFSCSICQSSCCELCFVNEMCHFEKHHNIAFWKCCTKHENATILCHTWVFLHSWQCTNGISMNNTVKQRSVEFWLGKSSKEIANIVQKWHLASTIASAHMVLGPCSWIFKMLHQKMIHSFGQCEKHVPRKSTAFCMIFATDELLLALVAKVALQVDLVVEQWPTSMSVTKHCLAIWVLQMVVLNLVLCARKMQKSLFHCCKSLKLLWSNFGLTPHCFARNSGDLPYYSGATFGGTRCECEPILNFEL